MNYNEKIELECTCESISISKWDELMAGAKKANGKKIREMIKKQFPDIYEAMGLRFPNPYESNSVKTNTHYIYVHSAVEYFFRIIN